MAPWLAIWSGLFLTIVVYGLKMFGDAVRNLLDPRLRGGARHIGAYGTNGVKKVRKKIGVDEIAAKGKHGGENT